MAYSYLNFGQCPSIEKGLECKPQHPESRTGIDNEEAMQSLEPNQSELTSINVHEASNESEIHLPQGSSCCLSSEFPWKGISQFLRSLTFPFSKTMIKPPKKYNTPFTRKSYQKAVNVFTTPETSKIVVVDETCFSEAIEHAGYLKLNVFSCSLIWYLTYLSMVVAFRNAVRSTIPILSM